MRRTRRRQSKIGVFMVALAMIIVATASTVRAYSLNEKSKALAQTESMLERQLEEAQLKTAELEKKDKYMQTKKYIEDEAKDKLKLVYPDEIVIRPNE